MLVEFVSSGSGLLNWSYEDDDFWSVVVAALDEDDPPIIPPANNLEPVPDVVPDEPSNGIITSWRKGEWLGSGSAGAVYEGITDEGFYFAVKEVPLFNKESRSQLEQEISVLRQLKHKNIVQYLGTEKDNEKLYIFLELMPGGSLSSLYNEQSLTESQVSAFTSQILEALEYLHNEMVIHRDVKCANILVGSSGSVKLADFGVAKAINMNDAKTFRGTLFWMAPEVIKSGKNGSYGLAADIWSVGCTVLEMLTSKIPYSSLGQGQALQQIFAGVRPEVPEYISRNAKNFIFECLQVDPKDRPSAAQLLFHPFVRKAHTSGLALPH